MRPKQTPKKLIIDFLYPLIYICLQRSFRMYEYARYRLLAEEINKKTPDVYPCKKCGTGECCKYPNLKITSFDMKSLIMADSEGRLAAAKVLAERSLRQKERVYCPFLNQKDHRCSIYQYRPLICMIYGYERSTNHNFVPELQNSKGVYDRQVLMCRGVAMTLIKAGLSIDIATKDKINTLMEYLEGIEARSGKISIAKFISRVLPDNRLRQEILAAQVIPITLLSR